MFNPFNGLDGVLLYTAQKFCDKVHRFTGLTKFWLEKWSMILVVVFYSVSSFIIMDTGLLVITIFLTPVSIVMLRLIEMDEARFVNERKLEKPIFLPPFRLMASLFMLFLAFVGVLGSDINETFLAHGSVSYILFAYFGACVPKPPSKSKMREWYEKTLAWLNNKLATPPVPTTNR